MCSLKVLVFPEFGLTPYPADKRSALYPFAEVIPSASERVIPCNNSAFSDRPVLSTMSCAALKNKINVLVNTVDYVACDATVDANCPADDHYQYNTDIVFDEQGMLVAKYHKSHEWPGLRDAYDQPTSTSQVTFKSSFGVEFGLFICFDIMFEDPPVVSFVPISVYVFRDVIVCAVVAKSRHPAFLVCRPARKSRRGRDY